MLKLSTLQELGIRSTQRAFIKVEEHHSFELTVDLPSGPVSSRQVPEGGFTLGRSPHCDIVLPELDVEVLAHLRLSRDGRTTILPFVSDLFHGSSMLSVG